MAPGAVASAPGAISSTSVSFPTSLFDDGKARHFEHVDGELTIRYFILKSSDGVIRAAFDACDVCWPAGKGYYRLHGLPQLRPSICLCSGKRSSGRLQSGALEKKHAKRQGRHPDQRYPGRAAVLQSQGKSLMLMNIEDCIFSVCCLFHCAVPK